MSDTTVLLGLFDGLHIGHMSAVNEFMKHVGRRIVYTFDSASMTTKGERGLLLTDREKRQRLLSLGADEVVSRDFAKLKDLSSEDFVKSVLCDELMAARVICGENFRFGAGGQATAVTLKELCAKLGIETVIVPTVTVCGEAVSTTRIRGLIENGNISEANELLGYPYGFEGEIIHGDRVGTQMGIKTVNIGFDPKRALPKKGVYMSRTVIEGKAYRGVTNVGTRPTVHSDGRIVIETHVLDFSGEVYGESAKIELLKFMREEKRFDSLKELQRVVANDINTVKETLVL